MLANVRETIYRKNVQKVHVGRARRALVEIQFETINVFGICRAGWA